MRLGKRTHPETNEDKLFVKSWKKWLVRILVLVFVVVVGTFFPRFKDIISFDILSDGLGVA